MSRPIKGSAFTPHAYLFKKDGTEITAPGTVTAKIRKDGGSWADVGTTAKDETYGFIALALTADEMNAEIIDLYVIDDTADAMPWKATIYTETAHSVVHVPAKYRG